MAETHTDFLKGSNQALPNRGGQNGPITLVNEIDCNDFNVGNGDTVNLFYIPAGTFVSHVSVYCERAEGGTLTIDVGDADTADGYHDGINMNSTGHNSSIPPTLVEGTPNTFTPAFGMGKHYSSAGLISALFNNAADYAKIRFAVHCFPGA